MPYFIFNRLDIRELRSTNISIQLVNHSVKYPLDILEDIPIKMGDFYVSVDFVIFNMAKDAYTQVIRDSLCLAIAGLKIDFKEDRLTFDVAEHHAKIGLSKEYESFLFLVMNVM